MAVQHQVGQQRADVAALGQPGAQRPGGEGLRVGEAAQEVLRAGARGRARS